MLFASGYSVLQRQYNTRKKILVHSDFYPTSNDESFARMYDRSRGYRLTALSILGITAKPSSARETSGSPFPTLYQTSYRDFLLTNNI